MRTVHGVRMAWPVSEVAQEGEWLKFVPRLNDRRRNPFRAYSRDGRSTSLHERFSRLRTGEEVLKFASGNGSLVLVPRGAPSALFPIGEVLREAGRMRAFLELREEIDNPFSNTRRRRAKVEALRQMEIQSEEAGEPCWQSTPDALAYGRGNQLPGVSMDAPSLRLTSQQLQVSFLRGMSIQLTSMYAEYGNMLASWLVQDVSAVTTTARAVGLNGTLPGRAMGQTYPSLWWALWAMVARDIEDGVRFGECEFCHEIIRKTHGRKYCPKGRYQTRGCAQRAADRRYKQK